MGKKKRKDDSGEFDELVEPLASTMGGALVVSVDFMQLLEKYELTEAYQIVGDLKALLG